MRNVQSRNLNENVKQFVEEEIQKNEDVKLSEISVGYGLVEVRLIG